MRVNILATCREPELLKAAMLVFDTIRVGFPSWPIYVWGNRLAGLQREAVMSKCRELSLNYCDWNTIHHQWIESLVQAQRDPFVICDTDMIFWKSVEDWKFESGLAGKLIPRFYDEYSRCWDQPRLHTCLMFIDPAELSRELWGYKKKFLDHVFLPQANMFYPLRVPMSPGLDVFYDTLAMAYAGIGGTALTEEQLDCFDHLCFGTIEDLVLPNLTAGAELKANRDRVYANPQLARGAWRAELEYYKKYAAPAWVAAGPPADAALKECA